MLHDMFKMKNCFFAVTIVFLLLIGVFLPVTQANVDMDYIFGFDKGPSHLAVVPLKKIIMVGHDKESKLDDYSFLAAVSSAVFNSNGKLFSNPLLFFEEEFKWEEDKDRTLNPRQGLDYFMEDWMSYCNDELDQMILINVPMDKLDNSWKAREFIEIKGTNPYSIAGDIALQDWSYSDDAVVAVIKEIYNKPLDLTEEVTTGVLSAYDLGHKYFEIEQPIIGTGGTYKTFEIDDEEYKYVIAEMTWPNRKDLDLQIFDKELGMVDNAAESYNSPNPNLEVVGSYIHNYGEWQVSVTAVPKKSIYQPSGYNIDSFDLSLTEIAKSLKKTGDMNIYLYPGTNIDLKQTPFGCRNANFKLTWNDDNVHLGFTVLDPVGTEICSSLSKEEIKSGVVKSDENEANIHINMLGECGEDDYYSVCVFALEDVKNPIQFTLEYSWQQNYSNIEGDCLSSASNGAVLASELNAPLLYVSPSELPEITNNVLYKLGVKKIHLVNIGSHASSEVIEDLEEIADTISYETYMSIYDKIMDLKEDKNDIIFTTIDPWTYWLVEGLKPEAEYKNALFIGPAAYIAAHHASPVIIIDNHPKLSQAATYSTDFWRKNSEVRHLMVPAAGSMLLSGRQVYDFLDEYNMGKLETGEGKYGDQETIITVAGQYDIGTPWDRMFTGAALPGRFWCSPVDTAYAICRNMFYPALIFENPALQGSRLMINGSESEIQRIGGRLKNPKGITLVTTKPSMEETFDYPILQTYNTFGYKFNEKAYKNWDFQYERADEIIPYESSSSDPIDDGVAPGKSGAYHPDLSETEVIPFYAARAGYGSVFSTEGSAVTENLNRGVIIWVLKGHGWFKNSGQISMWDPENPYAYEENPWRVYEPILLQPGNLREFVRWVVYALSGEQPTAFTDGFIKFHLLSEIGSTQNPDVATINPQLFYLNKLAKFLPMDLWGANGIMLYRDRIAHPLETIKKDLPFINIYQGDGKVIISPQSGHQPMTSITGLEFDDALENVHSAGLNTGSCLPACTYMHLAWMRHGMVYQIIDPWTTTDWNGIWNQMLIKQIAMGDTIGQAYEKGMRACGPELLVGQFWWDIWENVEFFGDPELRVYVPSTTYSDENHWTQEETRALLYDEELNLDGHMPFGSTAYPHAREPVIFISEYLWLIIIFVLIIIILIAMLIPHRKKIKHKY